MAKNSSISELIDMLKPESKQADFKTGEVLSSSPLTIESGGLQLDGRNKIMIADNLYNNLVRGDKVFMVQSSDQQSYVILARIRRA